MYSDLITFLGWILIDRCGKHFGCILNFLRDGIVSLPDSQREVSELLAEAKYYLIQELIDACESVLNRFKDSPSSEPICRVPLITSAKEELHLINTTTKPIVKLLINRHNNKYSYTSTSDDNILKNLELFDKLSLRFSGRVLFIKDVIGSNEICCWSFYGHQKKVAEVCCTSIVYATDKKHTKVKFSSNRHIGKLKSFIHPQVEFPEARIYEETLNILLYENRNGPDMELMQATSTRGAVGSSMTSYGSDDEDDGQKKSSGNSREPSRESHNNLTSRFRSTKQS